MASDAGRLTARARRRVEDPDTDLVLSAASVWEMAIKRRLGRLQTELPLGELLRSQVAALSLRLLPVTAEHALGVETLELSDHRDPFDRLLVAQALAEGLALVSGDRAFDRYPVERVW